MPIAKITSVLFVYVCPQHPGGEEVLLEQAGTYVDYDLTSFPLKTGVWLGCMVIENMY